MFCCVLCICHGKLDGHSVQQNIQTVQPLVKYWINATWTPHDNKINTLPRCSYFWMHD